MTSNAARAQDLLTKSSYCRNSKHARCKTEGCECKCHTPNTEVPSPVIDSIIENIDAVQQDHSVAENAAATAEAKIEAAGFTERELAVIADSSVPEADAAAQLIADRLDPSKAPAPAPKPTNKPKAKAKPVVVKGTVDGKLSNAHKRAIRVQMVAYLAAMPVELTGDLEGVTPEEAAAYVDTYWVKYIDPARDKARHSK